MASPKKSKKRDKRKKTARAGSGARRKTASKLAAAHGKPSSRKAAKKKRSTRGKAEVVDAVSFEPRGLGAGSGGQAGDLQGLSGVEGAASESVEELMEEGNAYEADIVKGVEAADLEDETEVESHEVPEDDVPEEYRDQD